MEQTRTLRVVVADDHESVREGLCSLLRSVPLLDVVASVGDVETALVSVRRTAPDVVILDLSMPHTPGLDGIRLIKDEYPAAAIVVLTRYRDSAFVRHALHAGASAYVLKQSPFSELRQAITIAANGDQYVDRRLRSDSDAAADQPAVVSRREREVLRRTALGETNKDIASALQIAVKTVEVHKTNAMRKLALRDRAELVRYAAMQGWLVEP